MATIKQTITAALASSLTHPPKAAASTSRKAAYAESQPANRAMSAGDSKG